VDDRRAHGRRHGREATVDPALMRAFGTQDQWFVVELPRSNGERRADARLIVAPRVLLTLTVPPALRADAWVAVWFSSSFLAGEAMDARHRVGRRRSWQRRGQPFRISFLVRPWGRFFVPTCLCQSQRLQGPSTMAEGHHRRWRAASLTVPRTLAAIGTIGSAKITAAHPVSVAS